MTVWWLLGFMLWWNPGMAVQAEGAFEIEATKLPSNEETYDIQLNIENAGADWEGTVRLSIAEMYRSQTAYDTILSLPGGSAKQFVVKVPIISMEDTNGTIIVTLLDKEQKVVAEKEFSNFLKEADEFLDMGILSDDYSALTYLDMGGQTLYFGGKDHPIMLTEVTQDSLLTDLGKLNFLVIDNYNTGVLTAEELSAIETWNYDGGILIVGTGVYATDTLAGFQNGYLGVECVKVYEPGQAIGFRDDAYVDWSLIGLAQLNKSGTNYLSYSEQYMTGGLSCSVGDGAIGILPFSLTELGTMREDFYVNTDQQWLVVDMLDFFCGMANIRYNNNYNNNYYYNFNMLRRMLQMVGNINSPLNFGVLKVLVILYVIFVGPVLYIILKMMKKKEFYWGAVPVAALVGILLIFLAGRGFEVVDARMYSVTIEKLAEDRRSKSFLYAYDASNKEWSLTLNDSFEYAGPLMNQSYGYDEKEYYHHICKEGNRLSVGIKPNGSFEDSYFCAGTRGRTEGSIECSLIGMDMLGGTGSVRNNTEYDFSYYVVFANGTLCLYENLPAGESVELSTLSPLYMTYARRDLWDSYMYDLMYDIRDEWETEKVSALAALGVGISAAYIQEHEPQVMVIGVVENFVPTVDDNCSELSYGCLYVVQ